MPDDAIRLTLPAEADLAAVAVAAIGALARKAGLSGDVITELRQTVADGFATVLAGGNGDVVVVTAWARPGESFVEIARGGWTETYKKRWGD